MVISGHFQLQRMVILLKRVLTSLTHHRGQNIFLVQVDSDTIAVAYENAEVIGGGVTERNGVIKTFTINSSDEISEADSLEHHSGNTPSTGNAEDNFLVKVDSDTFAVSV